MYDIQSQAKTMRGMREAKMPLPHDLYEMRLSVPVRVDDHKHAQLTPKTFSQPKTFCQYDREWGQPFLRRNDMIKREEIYKEVFNSQSRDASPVSSRPASPEISRRNGDRNCTIEREEIYKEAFNLQSRDASPVKISSRPASPEKRYALKHEVISDDPRNLRKSAKKKWAIIDTPEMKDKMGEKDCCEYIDDTNKISRNYSQISMRNGDRAPGADRRKAAHMGLTPSDIEREAAMIKIKNKKLKKKMVFDADIFSRAFDDANKISENYSRRAPTPTRPRRAQHQPGGSDAAVLRKQHGRQLWHRPTSAPRTREAARGRKAAR